MDHIVSSYFHILKCFLFDLDFRNRFSSASPHLNILQLTIAKDAVTGRIMHSYMRGQGANKNINPLFTKIITLTFVKLRKKLICQNFFFYLCANFPINICKQRSSHPLISGANYLILLFYCKIFLIKKTA